MLFNFVKRFGETVLDVIEKTSKIDMYQNKTEKYSALTPDIRIHYQTVFKYTLKYGIICIDKKVK